MQLLLEDIILDVEAQGRLIRFYVLKARREGISTYITGRYFHKITTKKNKYGVIVTHEPPATLFLFEMQRRYYNHLEPEFKPVTKSNNVKMISFDDKEGTGVGLDSAIRVGTAGVKDFGSGQMINYLHLSELAKWPRENEYDLLVSLLQCVPRNKDTSVIIESTAKGLGGEFYKGFFASRYQYEIYLDGDTRVAKWRVNINKDADPANEYSSIFIPWFVFKKYRAPLADNFEKTADEIVLAKRFNLDDEQINWYRLILANECKGSKDTRDQEYPCTAEAAFTGS